MPVSVAFRFLAGRYHATPFGHHVNEGLIEWPPSPWRVLRALISVGYTSGVWNGTGPPTVARGLIEKLSDGLPHYYLPPTVGAHSRHYMPICVLDRRKIEKTTLVFDTWAQIEDQEMTISWRDVCLDDAELAILDVLVQRLNYLGRSESWVEARVIAEGELTPDPNCFPERAGETPGRGWEQVVLLASTNAADFLAWRARQLDVALADLSLPDDKKPSKVLLRKRETAEAPYPTDLLDCLHKDTTWWRAYGWSQPPGSRRVFYLRRADAIAVGRPSARRAAAAGQRVKAVLLSLTNASRNDHALPSVIRTLPQAELLHRALVGVAAQRGAVPPEITGRDENRRPLRGPHEHAHVNPLDLDGDGHLDHVLVWAPGGLDASSQAAIRRVRQTFTKGAIEPLRLALAATGSLGDLVGLPGEYAQRIAQITGCSAIWQSVTPFVPPRYIKRRGKNSVEGQIRAELRSRGFPEPVAIRQLAPIPRNQVAPMASGSADANRVSHASWIRFRHFVLSRQHGPEPPVARGFAVWLEFESPLSGPIALGYGSHFGLGLFGSMPFSRSSPR